MDLNTPPRAPADPREARCPTKRLTALKDYFERLRDYAERAGERQRACTLNEVLMVVTSELCVFQVLFGSVEPERPAPDSLRTISEDELPEFIREIVQQDAEALKNRFSDIGHPRLKSTN